MKKLRITLLTLFVGSQVFTSIGWGRNVIEVAPTVISEKDKEALLFMVEEEKLARDTYIFFDKKWSIRQFSNIKQSEQIHIDAISDLLTANGIQFSLLPMGKFKNAELQRLYNQFIEYGSRNEGNALEIGATIEDLDIVDLQKRILQSENEEIKEVFTRLQMASKRHIRAFNFGLTKRGKTYQPHYLSKEEFTSILSDSQKCE